MYDSIGHPLLEMRCVECQHTQKIKIRNEHPHLTRCTTCKVLLVVIPEVLTKPGAIKIALRLHAIPREVEPQHVEMTRAHLEQLKKEASNLVQLEKQAG